MENTTLLKNKNFMLVFLGALVSNIGATLYNFAVSFYILKLTDNNALIQGAYLAVVGVVSLVFLLLGGVFADRFNKGKIMFLCDYIKGALLAVTTLIMVFFTNTTLILIILFIVGILGNIISGIFTPASQAIVPMIVKEEQLQKANSYFSLLQSVQSIIGIVLAGILYSVIPINALFFIVAGCYIVSGFSEMFIKYEHVAPEEKLTFKISMREIYQGFKYVFANKVILTLVITCLFLNFFITPISGNYMPYFIANDVANSEYLFQDVFTPEMWSSVLEVIFCVGMIFGSVIISQMKYKKASNVVKISILAMSLIFLALAFSNLFLNETSQNLNAYLIVLCCIFILFGFTLPIINVPIIASIQRVTDHTMMGKVEAFINVGSMALTPLASLLGGIVIASFGCSTLLFVCAGGILLAAILFLFNKPVRAL